MLNLARKPEQVVTIGDEIEIVVLRSSTGKVELG
ncbi:carbon storage regulator, partial [bacterium]|nr:carbon storage regulator [bacterium]